MQIARLTKGLALVTARIERGELAAIGPLVKIVGALDRYQPRAPIPARADRIEPPTSPLALTHAAPALAAGEGQQAVRAASGRHDAPEAATGAPTRLQLPDIIESLDGDSPSAPSKPLI